ncbi:MAG TPA: hypothetical protein VNJ51_06540 [Candidatus Dormibacteraeota bacterium]|nr:hypothetical protein [Candidatus Dormibacteraeota bacterium]
MRTLTICTASFLPLAQLQFDALGRGSTFSIAPIPHPLGGISESDLSARIEAAWTALESWLGKQSDVD